MVDVDESCVGDADDSEDIQARSRSLPRMGAKERNDRKTSLASISGEVRRDDTVCGVGDGVDATVCSISPI